MSEQHIKQLGTQLWSIANTLRGKMNADEFRDYILGFIFYKYLSEQMHLSANIILSKDDMKYEDIPEETVEGQVYLEAIKEEVLKVKPKILQRKKILEGVIEKILNFAQTFDEGMGEVKGA